MKLILHKDKKDFMEVENRRLSENLSLPYAKRIEKLFILMEISAMFKKGPIKMPQGLGLVLKEK